MGMKSMIAPLIEGKFSQTLGGFERERRVEETQIEIRNN